MHLELETIEEEILERLWVVCEEEGKSGLARQDALVSGNDAALQRLTERGLIVLKGDLITLVDAGRAWAARTVRRHRLAERLMLDVLNVTGQELLDETACEFEHLLHRGIEAKICTLLGHPTVCPHGKHIPPGECCLSARDSDIKLLASLAELDEEQKGTIAYLQVSDQQAMQKLMAMGVLPGTEVSLLRRDPSYVFQAGYSQFAVDADIARSIVVRLEEESVGQPGAPTKRGMRHKRRHRRHARVKDHKDGKARPGR